ncbi:hypothetical protein PTTG_28003 [Puccinia triticina 1-1 BBBD Race 1]|uniref:Uncharacterized protein n=1 Tax=Puccinia triticina (isolate 1-1 / race 1 (BBBD)) TaxID=630390 RepID=A0A180GFY1_PUCT1|nr:hypothetical protein PTTG_28003 [Puccinia triticina 1-1 BBBD Race 1]
MVFDCQDIEENISEARKNEPIATEENLLDSLEEQLRRIQSLLLNQKYIHNEEQFPLSLLAKLFGKPENEIREMPRTQFSEECGRDILRVLKGILLECGTSYRPNVNLCRKSGFLAIRLLLDYEFASREEFILTFQHANLAYRFSIPDLMNYTTKTLPQTHQLIRKIQPHPPTTSHASEAACEHLKVFRCQKTLLSQN